MPECGGLLGVGAGWLRSSAMFRFILNLGDSPDMDRRSKKGKELFGTQRVCQNLQVLRLNADQASLRAIDVGNEKERYCDRERND